MTATAPPRLKKRGGQGYGLLPLTKTPPAAQPLLVSPPVTAAAGCPKWAYSADQDFCKHVDVVFTVPIITCMQHQQLQQAPSAAVAASVGTDAAASLLHGWRLLVYRHLDLVASHPAGTLLVASHMDYTGQLLVHLRVPVPVGSPGLLNLLLQAAPLFGPSSPPHLLQLDAAAPLLLLPSNAAAAEMMQLYDNMVEECAAKQGREIGARDTPLAYCTTPSGNPITAALELLAPGGNHLGHTMPELSTSVPLVMPGACQGPAWLQGVVGSSAAVAWRDSFAGMLLDLQLVVEPAGRAPQQQQQQQQYSTTNPMAAMPCAPTGSGEDPGHQQVRAAVVRNLLRHFAAHHLWACCSFLLASAVTSGCECDLGDLAHDLAGHVHKEVAAAAALPHDQASAAAALAAAAACEMAVSGRLPDAAVHPADQGYYGVLPGGVTPQRPVLGGGRAPSVGAKPLVGTGAPSSRGDIAAISTRGLVCGGGGSAASSPDHLPLLQRVRMAPHLVATAASVPSAPPAVTAGVTERSGAYHGCVLSKGGDECVEGKGHTHVSVKPTQGIPVAKQGRQGTTPGPGDERGCGLELQPHFPVAAMLVATLLLVMVSAH